MTYDADVIVIGAGPGGCASAIRLSRAGRDVLVVERDTLEAAPDMTSGEVLAPGTQHELHEIGVEVSGDWVLDRLDHVRNVYPDRSWTLHDFPPGFFYVHVDRGGFNAALRRKLVDAGVPVRCSKTVTSFTFDEGGVTAHTRDGDDIRGRVVIDAAGRNAPSLSALKLKQPEPEFRQIGVAIFFESFRDAPANCWDRHLYGEHGAMISGSRIRPGLYRYILETDLDDKQRQGMKPVEFYESIARRHDSWMYERITKEPRAGEPWAMAPLGYRAAEVVRDRLLLVGDAAGYLSPVTGQGIELALRSARLAAQAVDGALRAGDLSAPAFDCYVRGRAVEVAGLVANLRRTLRFLRDRDALLRASRDDAFRAEHLLPLPVTARGTLRDEVAGQRA